LYPAAGFLLTTKMKNIITRSISGIVYVAVIIAAILVGGWWFYALTGVLTIMATLEYQRLGGAGHDASVSLPVRMLDMAGALLVWIMSSLWAWLAAGVSVSCLSDLYMTVFLASIFLIFFYFLIRMCVAVFDIAGDARDNVARSFLGLIYVAVPLAVLNLLINLQAPKSLVLMMFIMIWLNDTGAYCVGSRFGCRRLCERLSPKKSMEGFWGGLAFCIIGGLVFALCFDKENNILAWTFFGLLVGIFATVGDLFESMLKRLASVKDSGNIIPGHGGVLDRIDSLLFVAPMTLLYWVLVYAF